MSLPPPGSLLAFLAEVPDPRDRSGRRHPLVAMLAHACCAILCGCRGYAAIAQWGRDQPIELMHRLGYRRRPAVLRRLPGPVRPARRRRPRGRPRPAGSPTCSGRRAGRRTCGPWPSTARSLRGSRTADAPAVHLLAALDQRDRLRPGPGPRPGRDQRAQGGPGAAQGDGAARAGSSPATRSSASATCAARSSTTGATTCSRSTTTSRR